MATNAEDALKGGVIAGPGGAIIGGTFGGGGGRNTNNDNTLDTLLGQMQTLRDAAKAGSIDQSTYSTQLNDLVTQAFNFKNQFASKGSQYANQVNPQWGKIVNEGFATNNGQPFTELDPFGKTPYGGSDALKSILQSYNASGKGSAQAAKDIQAYAGTFQTMFKSFVGRDPTADEYNQFLSNVVVNDKPWEKELDQNALRQETQGLLSQFYTGAAQDEAQRKIEEASNAAVAPGSAFDKWSTEYRNSLGTVEKSLVDYQNRIMEKLRPQLLTSLKSQGLLDSGGLNMAFAGADKDLTAGSLDYLAKVRSGIEGDIANQKYALMSSPTTYKLGNAFNTVPNLTNAGQGALQNVWNNIMSVNDFNRNSQFQREMYDRQQSDQPSLLSQYGGMILGGIAGGVGRGIGMGMTS